MDQNSLAEPKHSQGAGDCPSWWPVWVRLTTGISHDHLHIPSLALMPSNNACAPQTTAVPCTWHPA